MASYSILDLFRNSVQRSPSQIAVEDGKDFSLSYHQLDLDSSRLASRLCNVGIERRKPIPLLASSCVDMVVGLLGILKAGASYVPIDRAQWPQEKIDYVLNRVEANVIVYTGDQPEVRSRQVKCVSVESVKDWDASENAAVSRCDDCQTDTMCVIFTSGTTDKPKGVVLTHYSVMNLVSSPHFNFGVLPGNRVLLVLSIAFDAFMGALFSTLCNSGTVILGNPHNLQDRAETANIFAVTPSILDALTPPSGNCHYPRLLRIVLGGETPPQKLITDWRKTSSDIWIAYGPTEATCTILTGALQTHSKTGMHYTTRLGQCIPSSSVMLVDQNMQLINEVGVEGEMFAAGRCLASGYWGDDKLTKEKFIMYQGEKVYRTGDMAKWALTDSGSRELEFLGRRDRITKIRGFLVNLGQDVDAKILQLDDRLNFSFSLLFHGRLVSVVGPNAVNTTSLLAKWKTNAPAYMVPDHLLVLESLPTMNGKTDVKTLKTIIQESVGSTIEDPISATSTLNEAVMTALSQVASLSIDRIDVKQSAISYGINSLAAIKISSLCRQYGFTVPVQHVLLEPSIQALIDRCNEQRLLVPVHGPNVQCQRDSKITPLQKALLLATMDNHEMNYVQQLSHYATADIHRIKKAWEAVVSVEPIFRTSFSWATKEPIQKVQPQATFIWEETSVKSHRDIQVALQGLISRADLGSNFAVLHYEGSELSRGQSTVVWTVHHALVDGFSASLLFQKVDAALEGRPLEGSLPFTVAAQDMEHLRRATYTEIQKFWSDREALFSDACGDIASPNTSLTSRQPGHAQVSVPDNVDRDKVIEYACTVNVTPAAIFNAAWILLLTTYTNSDTIVYGSVFSGRSLPFAWVDTMIGPLIQTLPVLVQVDRSLSAERFLQQIHREIQGLATIHVSEIPSNIPAFSTTVAVQDGGLRKGITAMKCLQEPSFQNTANIPLNLVINPDGGISLFYRTERFLPSQVQDMADIYGSILHSLVHGQSSVQQCLDSKFPPHMREKILAAGNGSSTSSFTRNAGQTISSLFQYSAWQHAPEFSIQAAGDTLTYTQLAERVDKIANIIAFLCPAGAVVAVLADRSSNWIVGMLAAMQADTIYCPVDSSYPEEYRAQLLERSGARILLLPDTSHMERTGPHGPLTLAIDHLLRDNIKPADCQTRLPHPSSTAYLCFTSGSTGQPKGVLCRHRGVVALYSCTAARPTSRPGTRISQMLSPGFDGCIHEIISTLCFGGTLVLPRGKDDKFSHLLDAEVAILTPSLAAELDPRDYPNLKSIHFGGEPVPEALVERWGSNKELYNIYGPTEASLLVCHHPLKPGIPVTLGRPLPSARLYVLNNHLELQPTLTIGEIYIAGVQISRGYLGMEKKTSEEIIPDPFSMGSDQEMMYRSGDIGFWDEQGNLHCCGRDDRQVKLRGYRINLDDIPEVVYRTMPSVSKAVAVTENGAVVLWVEPEIDTETLRRELVVALPPHSAPKNIHSMRKLPRTQNGKIDLKGLVAKNHVDLPPKSIQPLNSLEETLAGIWRQLLALDPTRHISNADDFAVLGGHSLLQLALAARIKSLFNIPITVKDIISASTLRDLAHLIQTQGESQLRSTSLALPETQAQPLGSEAPSPAEIEWIHRYQHSQTTSSFNVPYVAELSNEVDIQKLASALQIVFNRHRILRSRFMTLEGKVLRSISTNLITVPVVEQVDVAEYINTPFDLQKGSPIRATVSRNQLVICATHVVCDLTSFNVILREAAAVYYGRELEPIRREYFDSTVWNQPVGNDKLSFWSSYLKGLSFEGAPTPDTPTKNPSCRSYRGESVFQMVPPPLYKRLLAISSLKGTTLHQFGLAVVGVVLQTMCGRHDVLLGSPYMNRSDPKDMEVVGLFLQPLPVRILLRGADSTTGNALEEVRSSSQSALANALPWPSLLNHIGLPFPSHLSLTQRQQQPLFDCVVTFHDQRTCGNVENPFPVKGVKPVQIFAQGSKFSCLFEWQVDDRGLSIRYEYDTDALPTTFINVVRSLVLRCLEHMLDPKVLLRDLRSEIDDLFGAECQRQGLLKADAQRLGRAFLMGV
ncbi:hypothetical protein N7499_004207 [Penicillium canescens]|uniref:uncharacterized protein n=1 Tax=Penicillium canescens TaxID=5083 RepID=UPI0026E10601|nr:uncharacterized protein N7446_005069 [Penicillium canescens]KAJ6039622.1 hypothetical protein N7444_008527 [Penicillium canescens]KAJ6068032.1 hypothetical protein N7446_005069 [Penicillium canescens]KAJ6088025.1 hypothetical protein N7499_004207 [Penicillium canescens]KAJ6181474.1 hypothetical protein N7485_000116 [Penicillium canescens]